ncbi:nuclear transport factor 2 family protein [Brevibacterium oceani]|uniref:nuclear transport factor 2 family protein n=1 Tax=Brevibacterium oceani TaxID=358099 RepID=UPI001B33D676|nr:nuclear transport factor 2 family protein [Brevibacterium oceani]
MPDLNTDSPTLMDSDQTAATASVQWAADRLAMQDTLARYSWGYDEGDFDMLAGSFTEDGTTGGTVADSDAAWGPTKGSRAIAEVLREIRDSQTSQRRHTTHTFRFENQTATSADMHCYVVITATEGGKTETLTAGWYHATMVKNADGQWLIADLTARLDSPF